MHLGKKDLFQKILWMLPIVEYGLTRSTVSVARHIIACWCERTKTVDGWPWMLCSMVCVHSAEGWNSLRDHYFFPTLRFLVFDMARIEFFWKHKLELNFLET